MIALNSGPDGAGLTRARTAESIPGEASRLHRAIFRTAPPPRLEQRLDAALALLRSRAAPRDLVAYRDALLRIGDLVSLEVAARHRGRLPLLSEAFRLTVYLAETEPSNQHHFVKERPGTVAAVLALLLGTARSAGRIAKGMVLLSRVKDD